MRNRKHDWRVQVDWPDSQQRNTGIHPFQKCPIALLTLCALPGEAKGVQFNLIIEIGLILIRSSLRPSLFRYKKIVWPPKSLPYKDLSPYLSSSITDFQAAFFDFRGWSYNQHELSIQSIKIPPLAFYFPIQYLSSGIKDKIILIKDA